MLNQAAVEALYSATYIENYLDCVENLPDDLQRHITRVRELDVTYQGFLKEVEQQQDFLAKDVESIAKKRSYLVKVQQILISAQEVGDQKLQTIQQIQDIVENKARQLEIDHRNLVDIGKNQDSQDMVTKDNHGQASHGNALNTSSVTISNNNITNSNNITNNNSTNNSNNNNNNNSNNGNTGGERQSKRARRTRNETGIANELHIPDVLPPPDTMQPVPPPQPPALHAFNAQKKAANTNTGKKKKRKSRQGSQQQQQQQQQQQTPQRDETSPHEEDLAIDPDEPTYCLCDQISYGEMIMCDNDLCPFEWFHFSCVSLGVKPKGKWYCPKCRGDRSSIMKPKAQFLKELERYKKEKELREEKGS